MFVKWPFVSHREYQRALAERNDADRCFTLAKAKLERMERALKMVEWQPIHDPDTHELLGQLCHWCHRKPHSIHCARQRALKE